MIESQYIIMLGILLKKAYRISLQHEAELSWYSSLQHLLLSLQLPSELMAEEKILNSIIYEQIAVKS